MWLAQWHMLIIPAFRRLGQEDCPKSEAGLGYIVWPCLRKLRNKHLYNHTVFNSIHQPYLNLLYLSDVFGLSFSIQVYIWALFNPWLKVNKSTFISRILIVIITAYVYIIHIYTHFFILYWLSSLRKTGVVSCYLQFSGKQYKRAYFQNIWTCHLLEISWKLVFFILKTSIVNKCFRTTEVFCGCAKLKLCIFYFLISSVQNFSCFLTGPTSLGHRGAHHDLWCGSPVLLCPSHLADMSFCSGFQFWFLSKAFM